MSKNLFARLSVAIVTIPIILWICYQGGNWLFGMVALFAFVGMAEFLHAEKITSYPSIYSFAFLSLIAIFYVMLPRESDSLYNINYFSSHISIMSFILISFFLLSTMSLAIKKKNPNDLFNISSRTLWGLIYIGGLYPFVFLLGLHSWNSGEMQGGDILLFLFGILWLGDTAAMFVGKQFGKHKLAPTVSPNKSVEGFIGGIISALILAIIFSYWKLESIPLYHLLLMALGASIFGQLGDLVESMWKRSINIKDSSAIIPGHGGILDRFDSLLFAAPFVYFYLRTFYP